MRLIDAGKLKSHYSWLPDHSTLAKKDIDDIVDVQPTVDAVEVVRCKDSKYLGIKDFAYGYCHGKMCGIINPNDYCSNGEKKQCSMGQLVLNKLKEENK